MSKKFLFPLLGALAVAGCATTPQPQKQEQEVNPPRQTSFKVDVFTLEEPICIVGRSARIPVAGTPECFQRIGDLYAGFFSDGTLDKIKNKKEGVIIQRNKGHFGLCHDHVWEDGKIEFTYTLGVQVAEPPPDRDLPADTHRFAIQPDDYARIHVSAPSNEALGIAWIELNKWIGNSTEWRNGRISGEYEVYFDNTDGWMEFELWQPVRRK
ncbi:MAG: effector binding domain-containing protein [Kiritimatiellaeota bacterium]|nr:effector binding domain-containing protein [Kiritimatiellota bacterium]